jgi:hypothetical protein
MGYRESSRPLIANKFGRCPRKYGWFARLELTLTYILSLDRHCGLFSVTQHWTTGIQKHLSLMATERSSQTSPHLTLFPPLYSILRFLFNGLVHLARGSFSHALATLATF